MLNSKAVQSLPDIAKLWKQFALIVESPKKEIFDTLYITVEITVERKETNIRSYYSNFR